MCWLQCRNLFSGLAVLAVIASRPSPLREDVTVCVAEECVVQKFRRSQGCSWFRMLSTWTKGKPEAPTFPKRSCVNLRPNPFEDYKNIQDVDGRSLVLEVKLPGSKLGYGFLLE